MFLVFYPSSHLHGIVEGLYFHCSLSVCLCVCLCVGVSCSHSFFVTSAFVLYILLMSKFQIFLHIRPHHIIFSQTFALLFLSLIFLEPCYFRTLNFVCAKKVIFKSVSDLSIKRYYTNTSLSFSEKKRLHILYVEIAVVQPLPSNEIYRQI